MAFFFSAPRQARTTLSCPECGGVLDIRRSCHEAYMFCPACNKELALEPFIPQMDEVMENFLEQLFADRV